MRKLKKGLAAFLAACMIASVAPVSALAEEAIPLAEGETSVVAEVEQPAEAETPAVAEAPAETPAVTEQPAGEPEETEAPAGEPAETPAVTEQPAEEPAATETPAGEPAEEQDPEEESGEDGILMGASAGAAYSLATSAADSETENSSLDTSTFYRIFHLDCGRKYFTVDWVKALIKEMEAAGYNYLELAFGNDGLRFIPDDLSITVDSTTYDSAKVAAAIEDGNEDYNGDSSFWTEDDMKEILCAADEAGIQVIPLLNNPGHMDALLYAAEKVTDKTCSYNGSGTTIDITNSTAVKFTKAVLQKYIDFFKDYCTLFNFGADEYANDIYATGSMGFGNLVSNDNYGSFITYVNEVAKMIEAAGMTPVIFNDGVYFNGNTSSGTFDTNIAISFWTSGWGGYQSASASDLANMGHRMINTHGDFYYVLGKDDAYTPDNSKSHKGMDYTKAKDWVNETFMGSTVDNPAGATFCIWCDDPNAETETEIAANTRLLLRAMAARMDGNSIDSISTDVVSGGFNADGTINVPVTSNTVTDENVPNVSVTAPGLTSVTCTKLTEGLPVVIGAAKGKVLAFDMEPQTDLGKYTGQGTVSIAVPEGWNTEKLTGFVVENDNSVTKIPGTYKIENNTYTFTMPHFSTGGIAQLADSEAEDTEPKTITVTMGGTATDTISGTNYANGTDYATDNPSIATVKVDGSDGKPAVQEWRLVADGVNDINTNDKYLIVSANSGTAYALTRFGKTKKVTISNDVISIDSVPDTDDAVFTFEGSGNSWAIKGNTGYLYPTASWKNWGWQYSLSTGNSAPQTVTISGTSGVSISRTIGTYIQTTSYLTLGSTAGASGRSDTVYLFKLVVQDEVPASTTVTFKGIAPGTTSVTVGNIKYNITVKHKEEQVNAVIGQSTTITVSGDDLDSNELNTSIATVSVNNGVMTVTGVAEGTTSVIVGNTKYNIRVTSEDLSKVTPLTVEYWITNGRPTDSEENNFYSVSAGAENVYSEDGVDVTGLLPVNTTKETRTLQYWRCRLLDKTLPNSSTNGTEEQTGIAGDDETYNGVEFTKVRYWNGTWAVYTENKEWVSITGNHQLVAYYLEILPVADELTVTAADWGKKGDGSTSGDYLEPNNSCTVSVQVVYEDGTTNPASTAANDINKSTIAYGYWSGGRGIGTLNLTGLEGYQIWKVEAETGAETYASSSSSWGSFTVTSFTWDNNPMTVYEGDPVDSYVIHNDSHNPSKDGYYQNLMWDENYEAILIKVYVKAKPTEDTLSVIYYDEKFNDELYQYNIKVEPDVTFSNITPMPGAFDDNTERIDVTGCRIYNSLGVIQNFQTDLTKVPEAVGKYNSELYQYTGSVISEDKKTLYLYYNINTDVLSPMYVADFGLPIEFPLSAVVSSASTVPNVSPTQKTKYGTLTYNEDTHNFTYTPTQVLTSIDVLSISITFDGESAPTVTNVGVVPATTVYYEEGFAEFTEGGFTGGSKGNGTQATEVAGKKNYNYGYDPAYANATDSSEAVSSGTTVNDVATFTFTGTAVDIYTNNGTSTGVMMVQVKDSSNKTVKLLSMDTQMADGTTDATTGQAVNAANVPSVTFDLGTLGTYTVKIIHVKRSNTETTTGKLKLDGFRVYNTLGNTNNAYDTDENSPLFVELRDHVLSAVGITSNSESQYKTDRQIVDEVFANNTTESGAIILKNGNNNTAKDLLDNGPKNEIYLRSNESVTFTLANNVTAQIGMKVLDTTSTTYTITGKDGNQTLTAQTDMFYETVKGEVTIQNTGDGILSITKLKVFGATEGNVFAPPSTNTVAYAARRMGAVASSADPVTATAALTVNVVDEQGAVLASNELTAEGTVGESHTFPATDITKAVPAVDGYTVDISAAADVTVPYGETQTVTFTAVQDKPEPTPEPTPEPEPQPNPGQSIISGIINTIKNTIKNIFNGIFGRRW